MTSFEDLYRVLSGFCFLVPVRLSSRMGFPWDEAMISYWTSLNSSSTWQQFKSRWHSSCCWNPASPCTKPWNKKLEKKMDIQYYLWAAGFQLSTVVVFTWPFPQTLSCQNDGPSWDLLKPRFCFQRIQQSGEKKLGPTFFGSDFFLREEEIKNKTTRSRFESRKKTLFPLLFPLNTACLMGIDYNGSWNNPQHNWVVSVFHPQHIPTKTPGVFFIAQKKNVFWTSPEAEKMDPKNDFCSPSSLGLPNLALLEKSDLQKKGRSAVWRYQGSLGVFQDIYTLED